MPKNDKQITEDLTLQVAGFLSDAGCVYDAHFDNRGGKRARYLFVRKPVACKIRVSGHPSDRIEKDMAHSRIPVFDVGPRRMSYDTFAAEFRKLLPETETPGDQPGRPLVRSSMPMLAQSGGRHIIPHRKVSMKSGNRAFRVFAKRNNNPHGE